MKWLPSGLIPVLAMVMLGIAMVREPSFAAEPQVSDAQDAAARWTEQISNSEWLGPLAPIALSPFFGMACLSGIATYGPEWLQQRSGVFQSASPLNNPILFWLMAVLTLVTSLPRLMKVSKLIAIAADQLETYSVVILFVLMRLLPANEASVMSGDSLVHPIQMAGMTWTTMPLDVLIAIAAGLNIIVINLMKLAFELVIWLVPIPSIDAFFELLNKTMVAAMMGLYCFSPLLATILNLAILGVSLILFDRVSRRVAYYRAILLGPVLNRLWSNPQAPGGERFVGFLAEHWNGLPKLAKVKVQQDGQGYRIVGRRWWRKFDLPLGECKVENSGGLMADIWVIRPDRQAEIRVYRMK